MNRDEVTTAVDRIAREVAKEPGMTDATFVVHVHARVKRDAPEVIEYLKEHHPGDDYQAMKWFIPNDLGFSTS